MRTRLYRYLLFALALILGIPSWGQQDKAKPTPIIQGRVVDASNGTPLPYVQIFYAGTTRGTLSNEQGQFSLSNSNNDSLIVFKMMGYQNDTLAVRPGKSVHNKRIKLRPAITEMEAVTVRPKKKKERYKRKDNPAVELVKQVIAHKDSNRLEKVSNFSRNIYEKTTMSLDDFHPDYNKHIIWKHLDFVEKYVGPTEFDNTDILNFSITETMFEEEYTRGRSRTIETARRTEGLGTKIENEGIDASASAFLPAGNIYDNTIEILQNQFISPLSSTIANTFYHYSITDTIEENGEKLIVLSFVPASKTSYGFAGEMYITMDGRYAVRSVVMVASNSANLNFVRDVTFRQSFVRDSLGREIPIRCDTYGRLLLLFFKKFQQAYVQHTQVFHNYAFEEKAKIMADSLFADGSDSIKAANANRVRRAKWNEMRPIELAWQELVLDSFRIELMQKKSVKITIDIAEELIGGFIHSNVTEHDSSRFIFGSLYNLHSHNRLEGDRWRFGGQSTALFNNRNFFNTYLAYGTEDKKLKGNLCWTYTFHERKRHAYENPPGAIALSIKYDVEMPGVSFEQLDYDNVLMQDLRTRMMEYVLEGKLRYINQFGQFYTDSWLSSEHHQPAAELTYFRYVNGNPEKVNGYWKHAATLNISFTPQRQERTRKDGKAARISKSRDRFSINLTQTLGSLDNFFLNRTEVRMSKQFWIAPLGRLDMSLSAGKVWNQVPLPGLFIPNGNASLITSENTFSTMNPMEYIIDQHVTLFATYHMRGLILDRIPLIRRFKLREVFTFNMLYGGLSDKNNPSFLHEGLYRFPSGIRTLGKLPYMEWSVGLENILKVIHIDYVMRITYRDVPQLNEGWRLGFRFAF